MPLCDTLLRGAEAELYRIHFSQEILDGATRNLVKKERMTPEKAKRFQKHILDAFPEALVEVPVGLEGVMQNHPGDRHVLAAAVAAQVELIVTSNLKHFPQEALTPWNIEVQSPDNFLLSLCELYGCEIMYELIQKQAEDCQNPTQTELELLERLERMQPHFASKMLIYGYGEMIIQVAHKILKYYPKDPFTEEQLYSGKTYNISKRNANLMILEKRSGRTVFKAENNEIVWILYKRDVIAFQEADEGYAKLDSSNT
jgi:PIN domain